MSERVAKQVIVMRKDLNMRKGKMVAQGAHASLGVVLLLQEDAAKLSALSAYEFRVQGPIPRTGIRYSDEIHAAFRTWINGIFTKVCVSVSSELDLLWIYDLAEKAGLPVKLIEDSGLTEFNGVPTKTCLAIGPAWSDDIDKITGELTLL